MKRICFVFVFLLLLFSFPNVVFAQNNTRSAEVAILEKGEVINSDYFMSGERIILSGTINGDAYLGGGNITVDGTINGDLLAAGGSIEITGTVNGNIRVAGGNIDIEAAVGKNITVLGGAIKIDKDAKVSGSLVSAGGSIDISSPIGSGITVAGGEVSIKNKVGGSVNAAVGQLSLENGAEINGDLAYLSEKELFKTQDSTVSGKIVHNVPPEASKPSQESVKSLFAGLKILGFLMSLLIGILLLYFFPNFTLKAADQVLKKPGINFLIGLLFLIVVPIIFIILLITVIGIPLAGLLLTSYVFLLIFAHIFSSLTLGKWAVKIMNFSSNTYLSLALGLLILSVLGFIPIIGGLVKFVALMLGLGAFLIVKKETFTQLRAKKAL